jgi:hypothetical protein
VPRPSLDPEGKEGADSGSSSADIAEHLVARIRMTFIERPCGAEKLQAASV